MSGYIYLIHLREFIKINEPVYKVGRSEDVNRRKKEYPKGSVQLFFCIVNNEIKLEKIIKKQLKINFTQQKEYGTEYFKGEYTKMISIINDIITKHDDIVLEPNINIIESHNQLKILFAKLVDLYNQKDIINNTPNDQELSLINKNIENTITKYNNLISNKNNHIIHVKCEYEGHCDYCYDNSQNFCTEECEICITFRKEDKKRTIKEAINYYNEHVSNNKKLSEMNNEDDFERFIKEHVIKITSGPTTYLKLKDIRELYLSWLPDHSKNLIAPSKRDFRKRLISHQFMVIKANNMDSIKNYQLITPKI